MADEMDPTYSREEVAATDPATPVGDPVEIPYTDTTTTDDGSVVVVGYQSGGVQVWDGGVGPGLGDPVEEEGPQGWV